MHVEKLDLRKKLKPLYQPGAKTPVIVEVPRMRFLTIGGVGGIGEAEFRAAMQALFTLGYSVKFAAKSDLDLDYPVMAPEGVYWDADDPAGELPQGRPDKMAWKLMLMVPDEIKPEFIERVRADAMNRKPEVTRLGDVRVEEIDEGLSVQVMHVGPYADEPETVARLTEFAEQKGYLLRGPHHEIYIGDPNRAAPDKLKTTLRYPVEAVAV